MDMATVVATNAPHVTNSSVSAKRKAISAKPKFLRNAFRAAKVLAEVAILTCMTASLSSKALANEKSAEDAFKTRKQTVAFANGESRQDSTKNDAGLQKIQIDDVTYMVAPKNMKVTYDYSEKPKETQIKTFRLEPQIQILNAHSYFARNSETAIRVNGNDNTTYTVGPAVQFPLYNNQIITFNQNYSVIDTCSLSPIYPLAKFSKMSYFYMMTTDTIRSATLEMMRQTVVTNGGPYIGTIYYMAPENLPVYDWMFIAAYHLNEQGCYTSSPTPKIGAIGIPREWLWPPNNNHLEYLVLGLKGLTEIRNYQNGQNFEYSMRGSSMGSYALDQFGVPIAYHECAVVENAVGINQISTEVPAKFSLYQNYPNPFNAQTKMRIEVPKAGMVSLRVYDALGREVATLVNENMKAGTYEIGWNAGVLPSGAYFYRMSAGEFTETKKMLLVK